MFGVKLGGGGGITGGIGGAIGSPSAGASLGLSLPTAVAMKNESVTLHSKDGAGFGFEVCSDGHGGLAVGSLTDGGPAKESGLIRPGDRLAGISLDVNSMGTAAAQLALDTLAKANLPLTFNVSRPAESVDVDLAAAVAAPDINLSGEIQRPHIGTPDLNLTGGLQAPHVTGSIGTHLPKVDLSSEGVSAEFRGPDIDAPNAHAGLHVDIPASSGAVNAPHFDKSDLIGPVHVPEVSLPHGGLDVTVHGPKIDLGGKEVPHIAFAPKPDIGIHPKDIDITLPGGDHGIQVPHANMDTETSINVPIGVPNINSETPEIDIHIRGPSIGDKMKGFFRGDSKRKEGKGVHIEGDLSLGSPDVGVNATGTGQPIDKNIEANLPKAKIAVAVPNVELKIPSGTPQDETKIQGDIQIAADVKNGKQVKVKKPKAESNFKVTMPKFGFGKTGKYSLEEGNAEINLPTAHDTHDFNEAPTAGKLNLTGAISSEIRLEGPNIEIEKPDIKGKGKIGGNLGADVEIGRPNAEVDIDFGIGGKKQKEKGGFGIKMPDFSFGGSGKKGKADIDVNLPSADIDVKLPSAHVGGDVDVKAPKGSIEGGIGVDVKTPHVDVEVSKPKAGGGFDVHLPKFGFGGGKADANVDLDVKGKHKGGKGVDVDIDIGGHVKGKGDAKLVTAEVPVADVSGVVGARVDLRKNYPGAEVKIEAPKFDVDSRDGKGKEKVKGPQISGSLEVDKSQAGVVLDVDVKKPKDKGGSGFGFKLPKFGFGSGGKGTFDVDVAPPTSSGTLKTSETELTGGVDLKTPKGDGKGRGGIAVQAPSVDVRVGTGKVHDRRVSGGVDSEIPEIDVDDKKTKAKRGSSFNFKMPKLHLGGSKAKTDGNISPISPNADIKLPESNIGGSIHATAPKGGLTVGTDITVKGPNVDVDVDTRKGDGKVDSHLPKFGFSGKESVGVELDLDSGAVIQKTPSKVDAGIDIDAQLPSAKVGTSKGGFDVKLAGAQGVNVDLRNVKTDSEIKVSAPKVKSGLPQGQIDSSFKIGSPSVAGSGDIRGSVSLPTSELEPEVPSELRLKTKGQAPKIPLIVDMPKGNLDTGGSVQVGLPADVSGGKTRGDGKGESGFKIDMPKLNIRGRKSPNDFEAGAAKPYVETELPDASAEISVSGPRVDIHVDPTSLEAKGSSKRKSFGSKMKGLFSPKSPTSEVSASVTSPSLQATSKSKSASLQFGVIPPNAEMGVDVKGTAPSVSISADTKRKSHKTSVEDPKARASLAIDAGAPSKSKAVVAVRPHSSVEGAGGRVRSKSTSSSSSSDSDTHKKASARLSGGVDVRASKPKTRLFSSLERPEKARTSIETALRLGLPTVSVAAGNFGGDDLAEKTSPTAVGTSGSLSIGVTGSLAPSVSVGAQSSSLPSSENNNNAGLRLKQ